MREIKHFLIGLSRVMLVCGAMGLWPATLHADEIWVGPAKVGENSSVGNWATANLGGYLLHGKETHFAFHVPDNFVEFTEAYVVLIPPGTTTLDYTVKANVANVDQPHTMNPATNLG